jgi:hypothetical protein
MDLIERLSETGKTIVHACLACETLTVPEQK